MNSSGQSLGTAWMPHYWHSPPVPSPPSAPPLPHFGESQALWTCSPGGVVCTSSYLPSPSLKPVRLCSAGPLFLQPHLSVPLGNNKDHNPAPRLGLPPSTGAPGCLLLRTQPTASFPPGHLLWMLTALFTVPSASFRLPGHSVLSPPQHLCYLIILLLYPVVCWQTFNNQLLGSGEGRRNL